MGKNSDAALSLVVVAVDYTKYVSPVFPSHATIFVIAEDILSGLA